MLAGLSGDREQPGILASLSLESIHESRRAPRHAHKAVGQWDLTEDSPKVVDEVRSQEEQRGRESRPEPWESSRSPRGSCVTRTMPHAKVLSLCRVPAPGRTGTPGSRAASSRVSVYVLFSTLYHLHMASRRKPHGFCPGVLYEMRVSGPGGFTCGQGLGMNSQWV